MPLDRAAFDQLQQTRIAAVRDVLGDRPREFSTVAELSAILSKLPADTPVHVADHARTDPELAATAQKRTIFSVSQIALLDDDPQNVVGLDGEVDQYTGVIAGVELSAVLVAKGAGLPEMTVPASAYDRAEHALDTGDMREALAADADLLTWVAGHLAARPGSVGEWFADTDIQGQLAVEGERLRQAAARLTVLARKIAEYEDADDA